SLGHDLGSQRVALQEQLAAFMKPFFEVFHATHMLDLSAVGDVLDQARFVHHQLFLFEQVRKRFAVQRAPGRESAAEGMSGLVESQSLNRPRHSENRSLARVYFEPLALQAAQLVAKEGLELFEVRVKQFHEGKLAPQRLRNLTGRGGYHDKLGPVQAKLVQIAQAAA